ncbi:hypothetical protein MWU59_06010 [Flavobacteriaceae bacterium F08102]|nr:hypothetical protein [Flavobacteriaceae bacterium F08102]
MKNLCYSFLIAGLILSCNQPDKTASKISETPTNETAKKTTLNTNLKAIDTDEALIATALMAVPEESRAESTVIGYNMKGEFVTLKEGTNHFICLADDPTKDGFSAAAYHKDLEPFMARGRELKAEGKNAKEIFDIREKEVKAGILPMGKMGTTLHIYYGAKTLYNPETSEVDGAQYRYVVYLPFATAASTGLPEKPIAGNHPWIMDPGTHRAHIMISPLKGD